MRSNIKLNTNNPKGQPFNWCSKSTNYTVTATKYIQKTHCMIYIYCYSKLSK